MRDAEVAALCRGGPDGSGQAVPAVDSVWRGSANLSFRSAAVNGHGFIRAARLDKFFCCSLQALAGASAAKAGKGRRSGVVAARLKSCPFAREGSARLAFEVCGFSVNSATDTG